MQLNDTLQREFLRELGYSSEDVEQLMINRNDSVAKLKDLMRAMRAAGYTQNFFVEFDGSGDDGYFHFDAEYQLQDSDDDLPMSQQPAMKFFENHQVYVLDHASAHQQADCNKIYFLDLCAGLLGNSYPGCEINAGAKGTIVLNFDTDRVELMLMKYTDEELDEDGEDIDYDEGTEYIWVF